MRRPTPTEDQHRAWQRRLLALCLGLCGLLLMAIPARALAPPAFRGHVNDFAQLLSPATAERLEQTLRAFADSDSTEVAILTIDSLEGDDLEGFGIRTVERWGLGQRGKDNGVLLLVVKNDRKLRLEVGRGLEGVLTDLSAGRIIDTIIAPQFKAGHFDEGISAGVTAIIAACRGEFRAEKRPRRHNQEPPPALSYLLFGLFITSFLGRASRPLGVIAGAVLLPMAAWLSLPSLGLFLLIMLLPVGAMAGLILPFMLSSMLLGRGGMGGGGGFGDGGGGFSGFGGGSFGGGGASGSW